MSICVIGGAGYIGSVTVEKLLDAGKDVVVYDNLSRGHEQAVPPEAVFVKGDHSDRKLLKNTLEKYNCSAVMHFSALSLVGESVEKPLLYYENNVAGGVELVKAMKEAGVSRMIFSSTAAVYGEPETMPIREDALLKPTNPYGNTKLAFERLLEDLSGSGDFSAVRLRYFNAAGATEQRGEDHRPETHLIPIVLQVAAGEREAIKVFGGDYPTGDGACVRDYIHVADLAQAHILALEYLENGGETDVFNLGNGCGFSVLQVIETAEKVTGKRIPRRKAPRRPGDPAVLIASSEKIRRKLGWRPALPELETIIETAWKWRQSHPGGYSEDS